MRRHCISAAAHRSCIFVVRDCSSIMVCFFIMIFFSSILFFHFAASVDQVCVIRCSNQYSRSHLQRGRICRLRIPCNQNLYHILSFHTFLSAFNMSLSSCWVYILKTGVPPRGHWRFLDVWKFYLNISIIWYFMMQSAGALPDKADGKITAWMLKEKELTL